MPRTSVDDVRLELELDGYEIAGLTDQQIQTVGIEPAALDVDELLEGKEMSDARLELIERYLAGHHIQASGVDELRETDNESLSDGSSVQYAQPGDRSGGYGETSLGRKAISKDTSKTLANIDKPPATIRSPDARGSRRTRGR